MSLFRKKQIHDFPVYGGESRSPIVGPLAKHQRLARTVFLTTMFRTAAILLTVLNVAIALYTIQIMNSSMYVADGSRFGCRVEVSE